MTHIPYDTSDPEQLRRLAVAADVYLQGQLDAATAADQRALVFAGLLAVAAAALANGAVVTLTNPALNQYLGKTALGTAGGLLLGMIMAVVASRPVKWFFPGSHPQSWKNDFATSKSEISQLQELLLDYDDRISSNHNVMKANGRLILCSGIFSVLSMLIGGIMFAYYVF